MGNIIEQKSDIKRTATYSKDMLKRYEFNIECLNEKKEKSILVIGLSPSSNELNVTDTTTNYILNNLLPMKYTKITIVNLFACIGGKLRNEDMLDNADNLEYIETVLARNYNTVLVGYGNSMAGNKVLAEEKVKLDELLKECKSNVVELVDKNDVYSRLHTIHPLFAGQRFSGNWKFRKHIMTEKKGDKE